MTWNCSRRYYRKIATKEAGVDSIPVYILLSATGPPTLLDPFET